MSKKQILLIIVFIVAIVVLAAVLYFLFFKEAVTPVAPIEIEVPTTPARLPVTEEEWDKMTVEERQGKGLPTLEWKETVEETAVEPIEEIPEETMEISEVAEGGLTWISPVSDRSVKNATLASDGVSNLYYDLGSGHFYKIDNLGNEELLTEQVFYNVENVNWSPNKDQAILEYPDGFKIMYDFKKDKQYTLPKNWEKFSWNSGGEKIAFKSMSDYSENVWLALANPDGTQATPIEHMGDNADKVTVSYSPNNQVIAFSATGQPRGTWEQEILLIGKNGENFKSLVIDGRGFQPTWSPQGDKIVYSVYSAKSNYQPRLYLVDAQGDEIGNDKIDLGLTTWANKCAFDKNGSYLYCAVPQELPEGAGLVEELGKNATDDFYKIDAETGEITFLAEGAMGGYNVKSMYLSDDGSYLYFVDAGTEKLKSIKLK